MALLAYLMEHKSNYGPHLIIVPNAVLVNWKAELHAWLPSLSAVFYVGGKDQRAKLYTKVGGCGWVKVGGRLCLCVCVRASELHAWLPSLSAVFYVGGEDQRAKLYTKVAPMKFNVLVTTFEFIMRDRARLSKVDWRYLVIDEAHRMKDRDSRLSRDLDRFRVQRRLLLTGTPLQGLPLSKVDWRYLVIDEAHRMKDRDSRLSRDLDRFRVQRRLLLTGTPLQRAWPPAAHRKARYVRDFGEGWTSPHGHSSSEAT
ncbi:unnamed protein product [Closterium sp. NIES-54]